MNRKQVSLRPHNPIWAMAYEHVSAALLKAIPSSIVELFHIGSTALPGISAKPILDIMGGVEDWCEITISFKNSKGKVIAGLNGHSDWGWLFIKLLWV